MLTEAGLSWKYQREQAALEEMRQSLRLIRELCGGIESGIRRGRSAWQGPGAEAWELAAGKLLSELTDDCRSADGLLTECADRSIRDYRISLEEIERRKAEDKGIEGRETEGK